MCYCRVSLLLSVAQCELRCHLWVPTFFVCLFLSGNLLADPLDSEAFVHLGPNDPIPLDRFIFALLELPKSYLPSFAANKLITTPMDALPPPYNNTPILHLGYSTVIPSATTAPEHLGRRTTAPLPGHTMLLARAMGWSKEKLIKYLTSGLLSVDKGRFIGGGFMVTKDQTLWDPYHSAKASGQLEDDIDPYIQAGLARPGHGLLTINPLLPRFVRTPFDKAIIRRGVFFIPRQYIAHMMKAIVLRTGKPIHIEYDPIKSPFQWNTEKQGPRSLAYEQFVPNMLVQGYALVRKAEAANECLRKSRFSRSHRRALSCAF